MSEKLSSIKLREEYKELINKNLSGNQKGAEARKVNLERTPLFYMGDITSKPPQIPRIYTSEDVEIFKNIVSITHDILDKITREYLNCPDYRALFPFSKELEELILLPQKGKSLIPIARYDVFYHEDSKDFYFCEINTDGTSGMNEDRIHDELMLDIPAHQEMIRRYDFRTFELFESWVDAFMRIYESSEGSVDDPNIAIVDFMDRGTLREFQEYARRFQKRGINCEVFDIRDFTFKNGRLYSPAGHAVDAVYRRAVTSDIISRADEVKDFLDGVRAGACFLEGSFATEIVHHKWLFYVVHLERTLRFLTEEEREFVEKHVPKTLPFDENGVTLEEAIANKDRYVLKPQDSYASRGVVAGIEVSERAWKKQAQSVYGKGYICQEYCPQYESENIDFIWGDGEWHHYINMAGLFVYDGEFKGIYSRAAEGGGIIASFRNERTQPTYIVYVKADS